MKAFVYHFWNNSDHDSKAKDHNDIDDLVGHVLDVIQAISGEDYDAQPDSYSDHDAPNIFSHSIVHCTTMHTFLHQIPLTSPQKLTIKTNTFRDILIDTRAAGGNTSSMEQYILYYYHVGCQACIATTADLLCATSEMAPKYLKVQPSSVSRWVLS